MNWLKQQWNKIRARLLHKNAVRRIRRQKRVMYDAQSFNRYFSNISQNDLRNSYYTQILFEYKHNKRHIHGQRLIFKYIFFVIVCLSFVSIVCFNCYLLYCLSKQIGNISLNDVGVALTGLGGLLGAIIVLPQIIAKHLFPETGEKEEIELVKSMQEFDNKNMDYIADNDSQ